MRVTVIGGGSTYTPELVNGFLDRVEAFPLRQLVHMDIDDDRLGVVGGFARRMVVSRGSPFEVVCTTDRRQALAGASYVITQLRVGQMAARREDEYLGKRHGLIGQETTGIGGMAKALRTVPVILDIAEDMRTVAPGAWLVNFTNPSGLITEALQRHAPDIASVGVCNVAVHTKTELLELLRPDVGEIPPGRAELRTLGLNHLTWHRGLLIDGKDLWPQVMRRFLEELESRTEPEWDAATLRVLQMIPNDYLRYYYQTDRMLAAQAAWPPSRAEQVMAIEERLLREYADPARNTPPPGLMERGGAYYSTVATQLLTAHHNALGETHVVNTRHNGAVPGWPADWVLELPCRVDRQGVHPLPTEPLPPVCYGLIAQVKMVELLIVEAALSGDRALAHQALLAHPLGPPADRVAAVLEDMLRTHRAHLPRFWRKG